MSLWAKIVNSIATFSIFDKSKLYFRKIPNVPDSFQFLRKIHIYPDEVFPQAAHSLENDLITGHNARPDCIPLKAPHFHL